jgi:hypothetical protein
MACHSYRIGYQRLRMRERSAMPEDANAICKITVSGPGIQAEKEVSLQLAMSVMQVMFGGSLKDVLGPSGAGNEQVRPTYDASQPERMQRLSIREFIEDVGGRSFHTKIAAIGRYMRDHEGQQDFSRDDVKVRFRSAGEIMPGNFPRDFQKALQAGWIAEDPQSRGRFYVTRRGDEAIDQRFEGAGSAIVRPRRRRRPNVHEPSTDGGDDE